jgi:hypothetical protein
LRKATILPKEREVLWIRIKDLIDQLNYIASSPNHIVDEVADAKHDLELLTRFKDLESKVEEGQRAKDNINEHCEELKRVIAVLREDGNFDRTILEFEKAIIELKDFQSKDK